MYKFRTVLAACSPVLKSLLKAACKVQPQAQNPLVFLNGVSPNLLASIVDFVYTGEVDVAKEDMEEFLKLSQDLKVEGLWQQKKVRWDFCLIV